MTPFMQLRLWWRRASTAEQATTSVALAIVVALAAWIAVPTGGDTTNLATANPGAGAAGGTAVDNGAGAGAGAGAGNTSSAPDASTGTATGSSTAGASASGGQVAASGAAGAGGGGSGTATGGGTGAGAPGATCAPVASGTPGVEDKTIHLAFGILALAGAIGNSAAGVASPDDLKRMAQAVANDINARGGVQCRQITLKFYEGNPLSQDSQHAACLQAAQDKPFFFVDAGAFAYPQGGYNCLAQQKVPIITVQNVLPSELAKFSPYLASPSADAATMMRTAVNGLKSLGFFDAAKGFKKLGILMDDCGPEVNRYFMDALTKAGITGGQISKYEFECPAGFATPDKMSQAVSQFRLAGVTHVIPITGGGSFQTYSQIAQGQGFRPKYGVTDYQGFPVTAQSDGTAPNKDNFDGAIAASTAMYGQRTTPGLQLAPGTQRCQGILTKAGFTPDNVFEKGGGTICTILWMAEAAMKNARQLSRETLFAGLFGAGTLQLAYPQPDATFRAPSKVTGGDTWWPITYAKACSCWHVTDPNRKPSYAS